MFIEDAKARGEMYHFLAAVYLSPPTATLFEELKKLGIEESSDLEAVKREYDNLFVVPLGQYTTPYEAVYRDEREVAGQKVRGLLMGPSTIDVIKRYREVGAQMDQMVKELPDHIGVELAFLEFLCERQAEALEGGDDVSAREFRTKELEFLRDHVVTWVPLLSEKIHQRGRLGFYKKLVTVTGEVVKENLDFLGGRL